MTEPFILPETASVLGALAEQGGPHLADLAPADMRAVYLQLGTLFDAAPEADVRSVDLAGPGCALRAYFPGPATAGPVIVYMHGGGWVIGDLDTHHPLCTLIARVTGLRVVAVDYRMAPEHPFPAAHDDCLAAARFVLGSPAELEAPVTGIAVAGDSAGGNLAFHVGATMGRDDVLAQWLLYPVTDCTAPNKGSYKDFAEGFLLDRRLMDRFIGDYLPDAGMVSAPQVSPLLHPLPANLPPTVVMTAGLDPLRDEGRALAGRIAASGTETHFLEAAGLIHGLATMRQSFPAADAIIRRTSALFAEVIGAR